MPERRAIALPPSQSARHRPCLQKNKNIRLTSPGRISAGIGSCFFSCLREGARLLRGHRALVGGACRERGWNGEPSRRKLAQSGRNSATCGVVSQPVEQPHGSCGEGTPLLGRPGRAKASVPQFAASELEICEDRMHSFFWLPMMHVTPPLGGTKAGDFERKSFRARASKPISVGCIQPTIP